MIDTKTTTRKIKAKVLDYKIMYWGIYCGNAKLKLLEGENKGKAITIPVVKHYKKNDIIIIYESESS